MSRIRCFSNGLRVLAPARNFTNITGLKVGQGHLRTQISIDALSQKKGAAQLLGVILAFNSPIQFSGIGDFGSISVDNGVLQGENLRVVHEPVGERCGYRVEIALFSASAKGHHVRFVWHRSLIMWEKSDESC